MTNLERLKEKSAEEFWKAVQELEHHPAHSYIDYIRYLESEDEDIFNFIKYVSKCKILPSEAEIINNCNEARIQKRQVTESERLLYQATHTKKGIILEDHMERFGSEYTRVLTEDNHILTVPRENVVIE